MTINKLTSNVKPLDEVDKINETIRLLNGESTITNSIKLSADESIKLEKSSGNAYVATAKRTDVNNKVSFGIGSDGENRGIYDAKLNKWAFHVNDGKAYALCNEIATKADLSSSAAALADIDLSNLTSAGKSKFHALKGYLDEGNLLTDEEGLLYIKKLAHSTFDMSKFKKIGNPIITDNGIVTYTSSKDRVQIEQTIQYENYYKLRIKANTGNSSFAGHPILFSIHSANGTIALYKEVRTNQNNKCGFIIRNEAGSTIWQPTTGNVGLDWNTDYIVEFTEEAVSHKTTLSVYDTSNNLLVTASNTQSTVKHIPTLINIGYGWTNYPEWGANIDLKEVSVETDDVFVFRGNITGVDNYDINGSTVTVPYTKSITGSKISDSNYRTQISYVYSTFGYAPYYTLGVYDYTLPQGELYGYINKKVESDRLMPDFANKITASGTSYTAPAKGWVYVNAQYSTITVSINGTVQLKTVANANTYNVVVTTPFLVNRGDMVSINNNLSGTYVEPAFCFYPLKGGV